MNNTQEDIKGHVQRITRNKELSVPIEINGKVYSSLSQASKAEGLNSTRFFKMVKQLMSSPRSEIEGTFSVKKTITIRKVKK